MCGGGVHRQNCLFFHRLPYTHNVQEMKIKTLTCDSVLIVGFHLVTNSSLSTERCLEDHELVVQVQASMTSEGRFLFRKNYAKYEFFRNPLVGFFFFFFPKNLRARLQSFCLSYLYSLHV